MCIRDSNNAALEEMKAAEEVVIDVEMQAGEMPDDAEEPSVDDVMADVQETVAEATAETEAPAEDEAPAEPETPADDENKAE